MRINDIIHMIYDNEYHHCEPIIANCNLISDNIIANGKVEIKKNLDTIHFIVEDWKFDRLIEVKGKGNSHTIEINSNTFPTEYKCEITNFPQENRINHYIGKNIVVKLHRVNITSDFTIDMEENKSFFECDLLPLYVYSSGELGEIYVI